MTTKAYYGGEFKLKLAGVKRVRQLGGVPQALALEPALGGGAGGGLSTGSVGEQSRHRHGTRLLACRAILVSPIRRVRGTGQQTQHLAAPHKTAHDTNASA